MPTLKLCSKYYEKVAKAYIKKGYLYEGMENHILSLENNFVI